MICLIIAAWAMLLLALRYSTGRLTAHAKLSPRGGFGWLTIEWLFFRYTLRFRANLLRPPYLTLQSVKRDGKTKWISKPKRQKRAADHETPELPPPDTLDLRFIIGVKDEPALAALLCGWARESAILVLPALLPKGWSEKLRVGCEPLSWEDAFFICAKGMIMLTPVQIIAIGIQMRKRGE